MLASSRKPCGGARPPRRAKSPALHCGHKQVPARKHQPSVRPAGGPMKSSAPTQAAMAGRCAVACRSRSRRPYALHCRAGVHARRGGLGRGAAVVLRKRRTARPGRSEANREGIGKVMCRTPQSADADSSPYRGAFRAAVPPKPPLQGEVDAPQGADGGVHCRFAAKISCKARQDLALPP